MQQPSILKHLRDIIILPFTVTFIIPYFVYDAKQTYLPGNLYIKFAGVAFFIFGLCLFAITVYLFKAFGKGTLAPWSPKQKLIIRGPYKYCRNPMITGVIFILAGETLFLHSTNILIWTVLVFLINDVYFILYEEPDLLERFGSDYKKYKQNVPRWIPRITPYSNNK